MPMTLWFKRAKSFVRQDDNDGTKKFLAQPGNAPIPVPFWVAETETFRRGIADESIVNLTPPHLMPGYKAPTAVEETADDDSIDEAAEAAAEQTDIPKAEFGGQPLTPVQSGPKLGIQGGKKTK